VTCIRFLVNPRDCLFGPLFLQWRHKAGPGVCVWTPGTQLVSTVWHEYFTTRPSVPPHPTKAFFWVPPSRDLPFPFSRSGHTENPHKMFTFFSQIRSGSNLGMALTFRVTRVLNRQSFKKPETTTSLPFFFFGVEEGYTPLGTPSRHFFYQSYSVFFFSFFQSYSPRFSLVQPFFVKAELLVLTPFSLFSMLPFFLFFGLQTKCALSFFRLSG